MTPSEAATDAQRSAQSDTHDSAPGTFTLRSIVGTSPPIRRAIGLANKVAEHPKTTVMLHGPTGTGKELFARGVHYASANAGDPFVAINCAAIPENLLESELFGHEPGAFTDARTKKRGLLELAGSGTVFLDEISELPPNLQPKLLRVLEEKRVRRLGGLEELPIECRIVAATNRDLTTAVADGNFREDLYYRLSVFRIDLPPLGERREDIPLLARHFIETICREQNIPVKELTQDATRVLQEHGWPGNVRELKNVIERAIILAEGERIDPDHIMIQQRSNVPASVATDHRRLAGTIRIPADGMTLEEAEKRLIEVTLQLTENNQTRAARILGVSRPTIIRKIRKYDLKD